jgi:uncharacterized protein
MRRMLAGWIALLVAGCSGLLYYPDHQNYLSVLGKLPFQVDRTQIHLPDATLDLWNAKASKGPSARFCALLVHGNGQNASAHIQNILWMTEFHYEVFSFDYQGYGASTGEPSPENTVRDTLQVLDRIAQRCSPRPLLLIGQSLGGAVALRALAEAKPPANLSALVLDSTFLSYRQMGVDVLSRFWLFWPFQWLGWIALSDSWAPKGTLEKLPDLPILVAHGDRDAVVPYRFGQALFEKLPVPRKRWLPIPGGRHTESFFIENGKYRRDLLGWIAEVSKK